jgi:hypothetical protein
MYRDYSAYAGDVTLSVLVGAAFGTFITRFVWALFGPSFGTTEAVLGVAVFVLLSVGYSLPVYYRPFMVAPAELRHWHLVSEVGRRGDQLCGSGSPSRGGWCAGN